MGQVFHHLLAFADWIPGIAQSVIATLLLAAIALMWKGRHGIRAFAHTFRFFLTRRPLVDALSSINISRFTRTRADYQLNRQHAVSIGAYVETAKSDLKMVSFTLITGVQFHDLCASLRRLLTRSSPVRVSIALLDPREWKILHALAPSFDCTAEDLRGKIHETLQRLFALRDELPLGRQEMLTVLVHKAIPFASAILIDTDDGDGTIQVETKAYKAGLEQSWGFEVCAGGSHPFFRTLVASFEQLLNDGEQLTGPI